MEQHDRFSVFIAEDVPTARQLLEEYVAERPELVLRGTAADGQQALDYLTANRVDLLLLDIQLPQLTGIEVLERLGSVPHVIFTTAYDQYAVRAFDMGAVDYLLKPIAPDRFNRAIDRFIESRRANRPQDFAVRSVSLVFKENRLSRIVPYDEIVYISSSGKHAVIHTEKKDFETSTLLKDIESRLPAQQFMRIHKQYIVNLRYVMGIQHDTGGQYVASISDDEDSTLPVGKVYVADIKKLFTTMG